MVTTSRPSAACLTVQFSPPRSSRMQYGTSQQPGASGSGRGSTPGRGGQLSSSKQPSSSEPGPESEAAAASSTSESRPVGSRPPLLLRRRRRWAAAARSPPPLPWSKSAALPYAPVLPAASAPAALPSCCEAPPGPSRWSRVPTPSREPGLPCCSPRSQVFLNPQGRAGSGAAGERPSTAAAVETHASV